MVTSTASVETLEVLKLEVIAAPPEIVFESILEMLGPASEMPDGTPFPMKIEPWPGGRWYRDLGNNAGHFWAHVQVIKPPFLLELAGPLFMSYPAISHVQYRVTVEGTQCTLKILHKAIGLITPEHRAGVNEGWDGEMRLIRRLVEKKVKAR